MPETIPIPHGAWPTPIDSELVTRASARLGQLANDGAGLWWSELRPTEGARVQLVRRTAEGNVDVLPEGFSARTRVHEYGGGAFTVADGTAYFANWADQRVYRIPAAGGAPEAITPEPAIEHGDRYADLQVAGDWLVCVRERHAGGREAVNEIVAIPCRGGDAHVLVSGPDFVAAPRVSPDGSTLAWFQWDHPRMPWDGTELYVAPLSLTAGAVGVGEPTLVAGGADEAVCQPVWSPEGVLHFCSDRDDWWNVYRYEPESAAVVDVTALEAEVGDPHWTFGQRRYAFRGDGSIVLIAFAAGSTTLHVLDADGGITTLDVPYSYVSNVLCHGTDTFVIGATTTSESEVARLGSDGGREVLRPPRDLGLDPALVSLPEPISFPSAGGRTAHALFYPPRNPRAVAPQGELPPLIVQIHGGPTAATAAVFDVTVQYWTSRGFGVVDVDYGGSVGYGRAYRRLLDGAWGIVDVEDCIAAAQHLAAAGRADPQRLCITGGSAGGFTTLAALCTSDVFSAAASHYGVADLEALAKDTHKFESRYLDGLVGPYPEARDVYIERSPITHVDRIQAPLIVLQGLEDEIVPPNQAEAIVAAVKAKGLPVAYLPFAGEQHGFRRAENIRAALEGELSFYGQVFGFEPAGGIPPVEVMNL